MPHQVFESVSELYSTPLFKNLEYTQYTHQKDNVKRVTKSIL